MGIGKLTKSSLDHPNRDLARLAGDMTQRLPRTVGQAGGAIGASLDGDQIALDSGPLADVANTTLGSQLIRATHNIDQTDAGLSKKTDALRAAIRNRFEGETRSTAWAIRIVVAIIWLFVCMLLFFFGPGQQNSIFETMVHDDAVILGRLFLMISLASGIFAMVAYIYLQHSIGGNRQVRQAAENLGLHIAGIARQFDTALSGHLGAVNREQDIGAAADHLAHAHMTALEAQLFFRQLKFLHAEPREAALSDLARFLKRPRNIASPVMLIFLLGAVFGIAFVGIVGVIFGTSERSIVTTVVTGTSAGLLRYPEFLSLLLGGAIVYLMAGVFAERIMPAFGSTRQQIFDDALDSLRGAYTADDAPRFNEVIRRVEDTMAAFRSRIDGLYQTSKTNNDGAISEGGISDSVGDHAIAPAADSLIQRNGASPASGDSELPWRNRDTEVRFVDTGFQAAPKIHHDEKNPTDLRAPSSPFRRLKK